MKHHTLKIFYILHIYGFATVPPTKDPEDYVHIYSPTPMIIEELPLTVMDQIHPPNTPPTPRLPLPTITIPPLGTHTDDELASDLDAANLQPPILCCSYRANKGVPMLCLEDDPIYSGHAQFTLSQAPPFLIYNYSMGLFGGMLFDEFPTTHQQAMTGPNAEQWKASEHIELEQLCKLKTAKLVPLPPGARLLPSRWVYKVKGNGIHQAHFHVHGDKQHPDIDYTNTFASIVRLETLWVILAMIARSDLEARVYNIINAFLYALIAAGLPIYVRPPPGYKTYDSNGNLLVWLLLRALYGLK